MAGQLPERGNGDGYGDGHESAYSDQNSMAVAILGALLLSAVIIGVFLFITWFAYAVD